MHHDLTHEGVGGEADVDVVGEHDITPLAEAHQIRVEAGLAVEVHDLEVVDVLRTATRAFTLAREQSLACAPAPRPHHKAVATPHRSTRCAHAAATHTWW